MRACGVKCSDVCRAIWTDQRSRNALPGGRRDILLSRYVGLARISRCHFHGSLFKPELSCAAMQQVARSALACRTGAYREIHGAPLPPIESVNRYFGSNMSADHVTRRRSIREAIFTLTECQNCLEDSCRHG